MISFDLASETDYFAVAIQRQCKKQYILLKIGIHDGETIVHGSDQRNDTENAASSLEADINRGRIYLSQSECIDFKNRADTKTKFI